MSRVDAEGGSRGVLFRKVSGGPNRSKLRRASLEALENRQMLSTSTSTLPSPTVLTAPDLTKLSAVTGGLNLTGNPSSSSPSVAVDPINPLKMVATWINHDAAGYNAGNFVAPITSYAQGAFSVDGGVNWTAFPSGFGTNSVNVQEDFSLARPTNGTVNVLTQTTDASFAFDRNENVYLLTSTHTVADAVGVTTAGVIDLQRYAFAGNAPARANFVTQIYAWDRPDSGVPDVAVAPVLAVDSNLASYTDPSTGATQTDPYSGNVYVAWAEVGSNTYNNGIPGFNPNTIRMVTSSNQGTSFTHAAYVDNSSNANGHNANVATNPPSPTPLHESSARYVTPQIAISQGTSTVAGGQVTLVYDDYGTQAAFGVDRIIVQSNLVGGSSALFSPDPATLPAPIGQDIPITVNITDPKFTTLQALDITTAIAWPNVTGIAARVVPPAAVNTFLTNNVPGYPGFISLFNGNLGTGDGTANTGPNLGGTQTGFGTGAGTVFDTESIRSISDGTVGGSGTGHFRPAGGGNSALLALQGLTAAQLNGVWTFQTVVLVADTSTSPKFVASVSLNFSSGNNPGNIAGAAGAEVVVADRFTAVTSVVPGLNPTNAASISAPITNAFALNNVTPTGVNGGVAGANVQTVAPIQGTPILPAPSIASDNTLGSFSPHQGRMYIAFTGKFSSSTPTNTDIILLFSDDFGKTWQNAQVVNDDNGATDGFSGSTVGGGVGRTQYQPQVAVDQSTGTVVVSFLDARNDPSNARVTTYIAASNDGGLTFAAQVYANPTLTATDAITGATVSLGPVPDNQSAASGVQDTLGFGVHQALIVVNGRIIPFWASNQNNRTGSVNNRTQLKIVNAILSLASGPRIISGTQGPVGLPGDVNNTTRAADGTIRANTIIVTYDRPIDPTTFLASNVNVYFKDPLGNASISLPIVSVAAVPASVTAFGATSFKIVFNPNNLPSPVGTYSYVIRPTGTSDRIRRAVATNPNGNVVDQNANGTSGQLPGDDFVVGKPTGFNTYAANTLPLIVGGPRLAGISAINPTTGGTISTGTDNLVLNNSVNTIQLTFDRNIRIASLTTDQILNLFGPAGAISLAGLTITPVSVYVGGNLATYASPGASAAVFRLTLATKQSLSGTYTVTLGTGITGVDGSAIDANVNAGLDVLRGTATNGATTTQAYAATSPQAPAPIVPATDAATPSELRSTIVVPDFFPIQGDNTNPSGLTVSLDITYPFDPDLTAYLLAPDGQTRVRLFTKVGNGNNTSNFRFTTFDDNASTSVDSAGAPFFGSFIPEDPLSNLVGMSSGGTWTLVIQNSNTGANSSASGILNSWSLTFQKPVSATGLGEAPNDRSNASFRIFNLDPSNTLANNTFTAVGPTGVTTSANGVGTFAGAVSAIAVDPSDTTGNTVFVGSASGGIWKTSNFLTTNPAGPTYVPLTDFGPNFSLNIGGIALFGKNSDPNKTVVFAGTGFGQGTATNSTGGLGLPNTTYPNTALNSGRGVGLLRSTDGGATWLLLDSSVNTDANGVALPASSRDHLFVGTTTYKIVVDPTPQLNGQIIVYAALGGPNGGLYQSLDSGNNWRKLASPPGVNPILNPPTDILLDPNSKSPTTGNLDILYVAYQGFGVYASSNQGQTISLVAGQLGRDPLITGPGFPAVPIAVQNAGVTPNGPGGRIVLAKPANTANIAVNLNYQDWIYAATENADGSFRGLYVTKDRGENWTLVQLPNILLAGTVKTAIPTNDTTGANSYDPTSSNLAHFGNYVLTLNIDPTNPNIVYLGGSKDFAGSGLIRLDLTTLLDAHNFTSYSNNRTDGGLLYQNALGGVAVLNPANNAAFYPTTGAPGPTNFLNFRHAPNNGTPGTSPFNINATLVVNGVGGNGFTNDGTGVTWTLFDEPLKANAGDRTGSTNLHNAVSYVDPTTGRVRVIFADDMGVFTALVNPDGTMSNGIGTSVAPNYSRNGNLQNQQFFYGAAQPSTAAAQAAGALFYASGQNTVAAQSGANILSTGNLTWDNRAVLTPSQTSPRNTTANTSISSSDRQGVGIATDPTGQTSSVYEFDVPILGGNQTDFFRVDQFGQTTGLVSNINADFPPGGGRTSGVSGTNLAGAVANGQIPVGNFTVNPLNGNQILIGSATGRLYQTTNKGIQWLTIGLPSNFDGTQLSAMTYGAPDPSAPGGVGNLNNFIYTGTTGSLNGNVPGHIYVTRAGGQGWTDISSGLDGSSVVAIYTNPNRGSHAAYAITLNGVFFSADTLAGGTVWTNITSNLNAIQRDPFGNAAYRESILANFVGNGTGGTNSNSDPGTAQYGGFRSIVADFRYVIPAASNATSGTNIFYPVLYVAGYGGVFRSIDNGGTWTTFPNTAFDNAPVDGGYLPSVDVRNLQIVLGAINPSTGYATQTTGDPEVLLATTYGRGVFAIRLAPNILPSTVHFDVNLPAPGGSDSGISNTDLITNVLTPVIDGISEISNFGNVVTITLTDASNGKVLGTGTTDALGNFTIQINQITDPSNPNYDPSFFQSSTAVNDKVVGIQAKDSSGASGNITFFRYTLDTITPATPSRPVLQPLYDTGRSNTDNLTNLSVPAQVDPNSPLTIVAPVFDVATALPPLNPLTPVPIGLTVELLRATSPNGPFFLIDSVPGGTTSPVQLTDNDLANQYAINGFLNNTYYYEAIQVDDAGNVSQPASFVLTVTVNTVAPAAPTGLTLDPSTNSKPGSNPIQTSFINPLFDVTGLLSNDQLFLYRSVNGGAPILVGMAGVGVAQVRDTTGAIPDGVYTYSVAQQDVFGNFSPLSIELTVTINTQLPPNTPDLEALYDTGRFNNDNITDIAVPAPTPGPSVVPNFVAPVFDVNTIAPATGQPAIVTIQLFRATAPNGPFTLVGSTAFNGNPVMVSDDDIANQAINSGPLNRVYYYRVTQINAAGIESDPSGSLAVTINTTVPPTLPAPTLDPSTNTGLVKSQNITNVRNPLFNATGLLSNNQLMLYRSINGGAPTLVGTAAVGVSQVRDASASTPDGVYLYQVVQRDIAGNVSNFGPAVTITINTSVPVSPTIKLLDADDSGLPLHPNVTNVRNPRFVGTAQYNAGTNFPLDILVVTNGNNAGGTRVATTFPAANGTYLAQIVGPVADGTYTLVARTTNQAGTYSYSSPLTITIKAFGPQIPPTLSILPIDDTGIKGDGVTANHNARFTGKTDKGDTVTLYALTNGVLSAPQATATSSSVDGSFTFRLPFNLTNGTTQLVAQTSDIANNKGVFSNPFTVQVVTVTGDYLGVGQAQYTVFAPGSETYIIRGTGFYTVDSTPGRDIPVQYDFNGDGLDDLVAYRYNAAQYFGALGNVSNGTLGTSTSVTQQYGLGGASLPVSGTYGTNGTFTYGEYRPSTGTWVVALPQAGGLNVNFGIPNTDIPVPAAYDGKGVTEIAVFRPASTVVTDADSFSVYRPTGNYRVSFTNSVVTTKLGFVYKTGDIPAPADYDGVGKDEFAIYRPSTGQFFILKTPDVLNAQTWTLRTVTLNLPGGPNVNDVPVSQDYDGSGKANPTVYRTSNSTFYTIHTGAGPLLGTQENIQFGAPGGVIAASGPLLYRLKALTGSFASNGGFSGTTGGTGTGVGTNSVHSLSIASGVTSSPGLTNSTSNAGSTLIALAAPVTLVTPPQPAPVVSTAKFPVIVGALNARSFIPNVTAVKHDATSGVATPASKVKKAAKHHLTVDHQPQAVATATASAHHVTTKAAKHSATAKALSHVVSAKKGRHQV